MAVAIDNTGLSNGSVSTTTVTIASFAVGAGANRCIYLGVSQFKTVDTAPSATFNGTENFTVHDAVTIAEGGGTRRVTILKLVNPSNTTASIVVSWASAVDEATCGATSWTGVDPTTPFGTAVKASSNNAASLTVNVTSPTGDAIQDTFGFDAGSALTATGTQTQRWRRLAAANSTEGDGQSAAATGAAVAMTWNTNAGSVFVTLIAVPILQFSGGGGGRTLFFRTGLDGMSSSGPKQFNPSLS